MRSLFLVLLLGALVAPSAHGHTAAHPGAIMAPLDGIKPMHVATLDISAPSDAPPETAARVEPPPPPNPIDVVNGLAYHHGDLDTAIDAFHQVTAARGWPLESIAAWTPFVRSVIKRESHGCPGVLNGQNATPDCVPYGRPHGSAAGFGQVIFRSNAYLCPNEGLCSPSDITASPWNSMTALVALIEHSGRQPWCYTNKLRNGAICRSAPR